MAFKQAESDWFQAAYIDKEGVRIVGSLVRTDQQMEIPLINLAVEEIRTSTHDWVYLWWIVVGRCFYPISIYNANYTYYQTVL